MCACQCVQVCVRTLTHAWVRACIVLRALSCVRCRACVGVHALARVRWRVCVHWCVLTCIGGALVVCWRRVDGVAGCGLVRLECFGICWHALVCVYGGVSVCVCVHVRAGACVCALASVRVHCVCVCACIVRARVLVGVRCWLCVCLPVQCSVRWRRGVHRWVCKVGLCIGVCGVCWWVAVVGTHPVRREGV